MALLAYGRSTADKARRPCVKPKTAKCKIVNHQSSVTAEMCTCTLHDELILLCIHICICTYINIQMCIYVANYLWMNLATFTPLVFTVGGYSNSLNDDRRKDRRSRDRQAHAFSPTWLQPCAYQGCFTPVSHASHSGPHFTRLASSLPQSKGP